MGGPFKDMTGLRFGRLTVSNKAYKPVGRCWFWECKCDCGQTKITDGKNLRTGGTRSCGCLLREMMRERGRKEAHIRFRHGHNKLELNPNWKGGTKLNQGYVIKTIGSGQYKAEHRIVMEQILGRPLSRLETVHHKNGIRHDNRPDNLELWSSRHPSGQRVSDLRSLHNHPFYMMRGHAV